MSLIPIEVKIILAISCLFFLTCIGYIVYRKIKKMPVKKIVVFPLFGVIVILLSMATLRYTSLIYDDAEVLGALSSNNIGFDNIEKWGGELVEIQPDDYGNLVREDGDGKYVIIQNGTGFWEFIPSESQFLASSFYVESFNRKDTDVCELTVIDDDTVSVVETWDSYLLQITERIEERNVIILKFLNGSRDEYMMPFKNIDFTKEAVFYKEGETYGENSYHYYKVYLR